MRSAIWSEPLRRALLGAALALACACEPRTGRPNILLVTLDTVRADHVGASGGPADLTPHLDALAREGLVFEAAFTAMPTTAPAHVSLFTGLPPSRHGCTRNGVPMQPALRASELAARLAAAGYATAAFVTTPLLGPAATGLAGFETHDANRGGLRPGREAVTGALRWLDVVRREPVFLWLHFYDAHAPYGPADRKAGRLPLRESDYGWVDARRWADPEARRQKALEYAAGVREADAALGQLLEGVRARLSGPLFVAVVADHGESLDEHLAARGYAFDHGEFLDPETIRIPLVLAGPGVAPGRSTALATHVDLYTTLLAVAGIDDPEAEGAGRRDLRAAADAPRTVVVERRSFAETSMGAPNDAAAARVRSHRVAATDGRSIAIVGEDGAAAPDAGAASGPLLDAARAALAGLRPGGPAPAVDPATEAALRSLGYAP